MAAHAVVRSDEDVARRMQTIDTLTELFGFDKVIAEEAFDALGWSEDISVYYNFIFDTGLAKDDAGGPVIPIDDCPHLPTTASTTVLDPTLFLHSVYPGATIFQAGCSGPYVDVDAKQPAAAIIKVSSSLDEATNVPAATTTSTTTTTVQTCCGLATENWLCLACGVVRCSRYQHGHCRLHYYNDELHQPHQQPPQHAVHVSLSDLSVWCHSCQKYLSTSTGATGQVLHRLVTALEERKHHGAASVPPPPSLQLFF
jgi:Zn-finger in ubiquitin-hydrolases and other protein